MYILQDGLVATYTYLPTDTNLGNMTVEFSTLLPTEEQYLLRTILYVTCLLNNVTCMDLESIRSVETTNASSGTSDLLN